MLHHLCKLNKALYGLKQVPRAWFSSFGGKLLELGCVGFKVDSSLFIFRSTNVTIFIFIYVDDIIITASILYAIDDVLQHLRVNFVVKDWGNLNLFLGIEVLPLQSGILKRRYILDLLKKTNMLDVKLITSLIASSYILSAYEGDPIKDPSLYRSMVGSL